jgi:hypothetical protein
MWMKLILFLSVVAALQAQSVQLVATRLGEHRIGESLQEWFAISHELDRLDTLCHSRKRGLQGQVDKSNCRALQNIRDGKHNEISTDNYNRNYIWKFSDGKLSEVQINIPGPFALASIQPNIQDEIGFLIQTYGKPSKVETVPYQNSYGARWDCAEVSWEMPDGVQIFASEHIGNPSWGGPRRELLVLLLSKEALDRKTQSKPNPYAR